MFGIETGAFFKIKTTCLFSIRELRAVKELRSLRISAATVAAVFSVIVC